jgi:hypothetical protein
MKWGYILPFFLVLGPKQVSSTLSNAQTYGFSSGKFKIPGLEIVWFRVRKITFALPCHLIFKKVLVYVKKNKRCIKMQYFIIIAVPND